MRLFWSCCEAVVRLFWSCSEDAGRMLLTTHSAHGCSVILSLRHYVNLHSLMHV